ncbi:MAG: hypothetical protein JWM11_7916, partial [Planctomycetaceae bacterium]|nr:hypothetical protein [Planctomycetaceae bacterium]
DNAPELNSTHVTMPPGFPMGAMPVDKMNNFTLYRKGKTVDECNQNNSGVLKLTDATQTLTPVTDVFREFHRGNDDEPCTIDTLNQSVHDGIAAALPKLKDGDSKTRLAALKNYNLMGAMWLNNPAYFREGVDFVLLDEIDPSKKILGGDKQLSNATIETFSQDWVAMTGSTPTMPASRNSQFCFDCHRTTQQGKNGVNLPAMRLGVSQTLVQRYFQAATQPVNNP